MKHSPGRVTSLLCCILVMVFSVTGCNNDERASNNKNAGNFDNQEISNSKNANPSSIHESSVKEEISTANDLWEMDYAAFFSKEHSWTDETLTDPDNEIFYEVKTDGTVVKYQLILPEGADTWERTDEVVLPKELGIVNECYVVYEKPIFIVDGHKIVQTDAEGQHGELLYESPDPISQIRATRELVFFVKGKTVQQLCRLHRKSGRVDEIATSETGIDSYSPLSNYATLYTVQTREWKDYAASGGSWEDTPDDMVVAHVYYCNTNTGEIREVRDSDYDNQGNFLYEIN